MPESYFTAENLHNVHVRYFRIMLKSAKLDAHGQCWINDLSLFYLGILYHPGKNNAIAGSLSRIPREEVTYVLDATEQRKMVQQEEWEDVVAMVQLQSKETVPLRPDTSDIAEIPNWRM